MTPPCVTPRGVHNPDGGSHKGRGDIPVVGHHISTIKFSHPRVAHSLISTIAIVRKVCRIPQSHYSHIPLQHFCLPCGSSSHGTVSMRMKSPPPLPMMPMVRDSPGVRLFSSSPWPVGPAVGPGGGRGFLAVGPPVPDRRGAPSGVCLGAAGGGTGKGEGAAGVQWPRKGGAILGCIVYDNEIIVCILQVRINW